MVVEKGYKQTEIGVIPEDWVVGKMGEYLKSKPDYGIGAAAVKYNDNLFTYLRITDISDDGKFDKTNLASVDNINAEKYILKNNEIVVARTGASVGKTYLYTEKDGKLVFAGFLIRLKPDLNKISSAYLFAVTQTNYYKSWIINNSMRSGQPGINSNQINNIQLPIPPLPEQTAIANALSDMDALIAQTENLIEKKKAIKQGVMQELLKPKECWVTKKLGEVCEIYQPQTISAEKFTNDGYLVYGANGIVGFYHSYNHKEWQVMITCRGSTCGTVNKSNEYCWITGNAMVMNVDSNKEIDKEFFYYLLSKQDFSSTITGSGQPQIVRAPLANFWIALPKDKNEQSMIGKTLSEIDFLIDKLESKLQKLKNQKQGMMQALLTGKIRLI